MCFVWYRCAVLRAVPVPHEPCSSTPVGTLMISPASDERDTRRQGRMSVAPTREPRKSVAAREARWSVAATRGSVFQRVSHDELVDEPSPPVSTVRLQVNVLRRGQLFGEIGVLQAVSRTASVVAQVCSERPQQLRVERVVVWNAERRDRAVPSYWAAFGRMMDSVVVDDGQRCGG
jgi:hypothetical protein